MHVFLTLSVKVVTALDNHPKFQLYIVLRTDYQKISYKRRVYESVDDKSLSLAISQKTIKKGTRD